jgi:hypothetical protein
MRGRIDADGSGSLDRLPTVWTASRATLPGPRNAVPYVYAHRTPMRPGAYQRSPALYPHGARLNPLGSRRVEALGSLFAVGQLSQLRQRPPENARHLHLRHADDVGNLSLGEILHEAQLEYASLATRQLLGC